MFKMDEVMETFNKLSVSDKELVCSSLFYCLNWYREVSGSFANFFEEPLKIIFAILLSVMQLSFNSFLVRGDFCGEERRGGFARLSVLVSRNGNIEFKEVGWLRYREWCIFTSELSSEKLKTRFILI